MPKYEIVSVDNVKSLPAIYNLSDENSIFALKVQNAELSYTDDGKDIILSIFENDEKVGFVYTDMLKVEDNLYISHIVASMDATLQSSLFFKKCQGFPIEMIASQEEKDVPAFIQSTLMSMGYTYEHLAEPLTIMAVVK
jgi:hypothetical protein